MSTIVADSKPGRTNTADILSQVEITRRRAELRHRHAGVVELLEGERNEPRLVNLRLAQIGAVEAELEFLDVVELAQTGGAR